ncbi:MAG: bifunctional tetrahydrofolate synthase/dihydrofolate synthase [Candidatus Reddybacter sp.]
MQEQGERKLMPHSLKGWLSLLEARHPCEIELGLDRIAKVGEALKLTRPATKVITVAGTNGKGSAVAIMEAVLLRKGRRVGAYTSPHLLQYNERVRIDGQPVTNEELCAAFARIEAACGDVSLSYFEFGTLAALLIFEQAGLDVALLEVGLGGRLDAVNIVDADIGIITSIALDHESWLGDNREQIALEKAGIARANKPLVCAEGDMPATLLPQLNKRGAKPYILGGSDFFYGTIGQTLTLNCIDSSGERQTYSHLPLPHVPLPSALCAVQALLLLDEPEDGEVVCEQGLQAVFSDTCLPGRLQKLRFHENNIILDVAHNPAAAKLLAQNLSTRKPGAIHALFSVMADKNIAGIVSPLCHLVSHWHIADLPTIARAARASDIVDVLKTCDPDNIESSTYPTIEMAMAGALQQMQPEDTLLGFGSFYTVADILAFIEAETPPEDAGTQ